MRKLIMRINTDLPPGEGLGFLGPQAGPPNLLIFWVTFLRIWCLQWFFMNFLHCRVSLWSGFECEVFFLSVYVEFDFSFSDVNVGIGSAQKWPSKDTFESGLMSKTTKSTGTRKSLILTGMFSAMPNGCRTDWSASCRHIDVGSRVACSSFL